MKKRPLKAQLLDDWQEHPLDIGMIVGFVALPVGWVLQDCVLSLATELALPPPERLFVLFSLGALPGAFVGGGISRAIAAYRCGNKRASKINLLGFGGALCAATLLMLAVFAARGAGFAAGEHFLFGQLLPRWISLFLTPLILKNFPFHCALAMFCCGLFMRGRR